MPPPSCSQALGGCSRVGRLEMVFRLPPLIDHRHRSSRSLTCTRTTRNCSALRNSTQRRRRWQMRRGAASWRRFFVGIRCFLSTCLGDSRQLSWELKRKTLLDRTQQQQVTGRRPVTRKHSPSSSQGTSRRRSCSKTWRRSPSGWPGRTGPISSTVDRSSFFLRVEKEWMVVVGISSAAAASRPQQAKITPPPLATRPHCSHCRCWPLQSRRLGPTTPSSRPRRTRPRVNYSLGRASRR